MKRTRASTPAADVDLRDAGLRTYVVSSPKSTIISNEVLPLALPAPRHLPGGQQIVPYDRDLLRAAWPEVWKLIEAQGHPVNHEGFVPPRGRIIDYDLALIAFAELWVGAIVAGDGSRPQVSGLMGYVRSHAAKEHLMNMRGELWDSVHGKTPVRPDWPNGPDGERWVKSRFMHMARAGSVLMSPDAHDGLGRRVYDPDLTKVGLARAVWAAATVLPHGTSSLPSILVDQLGVAVPAP